MLLAIDVGNTSTVAGLHEASSWVAVWRRATRWDDTEDEIAAWFQSVFSLSRIEPRLRGVAVASVVPQLNDTYARFATKWLDLEARFLSGGEPLGIEVLYEPASAVGADRLANALGALDKFDPPLIVVDFGTATTLDAVSREGAYVGGAILPGVSVASEALFARTAKLPQIEFAAPERAVGRNTVESLQAGTMFGYAGAINELVRRFKAELGEEVRVIGTGGFGAKFVGLCDSIEVFEPNLTLDGIRIAFDRLESRART